MPIKPFKTVQQQRSIQLTRGLHIPNYSFFDEYISKNNYFNVINGIEDLLLHKSGSRGKSYKTESFEDFVRLHKFDKKLNSEVVNILHDFEQKLKNIITINFCETYCRSPLHTMQYTNKNKYVDIKSTFGSNYPLYEDQYEKIVDDFNIFVFFKSNFLKKLVEKNDYIDENIYSVMPGTYTAPTGCNSFQNSAGREVVVPLWVAIGTLDFGGTIRFCHYLDNRVMNKVLHDFGLGPSDRELFLNSLDVIRELRNSCAHYSLINRFYTPLSTKILPSLINRLSLNPLEARRRVLIPATGVRIWKNAAKLSLFDSLKVLGMYEDLSRLKKPLKNIIYQNNKYFKKNDYDLNHRLLERMGNSNYQEWKKLFSQIS